MNYPKNKKVAFKIKEGDWNCVAYWGDGPDALVIIKHKGKHFKDFQYPAYKIFNIAAHFNDIIEDFERGLAIASSPF